MMHGSLLANHSFPLNAHRHTIGTESAIDLTVKQRGVLEGIIAGAAITFVVILGAALAGPMMLSPEATVGERIAFALRADAFSRALVGDIHRPAGAAPLFQS